MPAPVMNAPITNTYLTTGASAATNVREDLSDIIYKIDPEETPLVSALRRKNAKQILTEWLTTNLASPDENRQPEGFQYRADPPQRPARLSNVCQIMTRTVTVSNSLIASDTIGSEDEFDAQRIDRGKEVRRDLEWAITRPQTKDVNDPRRMAGLPSFIKYGSVGAGGALSSGDGVTAPVPGTARNFTLAMIGDAMQAAFTAGGRPDLAVVAPNIKRTFSNLAAAGGAAMQNVLQSTTARPATVVASAQIYVTDFGPVEFQPDIFAPNNQVLIVDTDRAEIAPLPGRDMISEEYAKTGDARNGGVVFEGTLRVPAPDAHAGIFGLNP
jgi:hypothetical protein